MSMIFEDETAETEAERTRDFSGISSQDPQAESERAFEIEVGQQAAGMRIDSYLTEEIEDAARSYIQRLIEEGRIAVQGRPKTAKNYKLRAGDRIFVRIPPPKKLDVAAEDIPLDIVYEDDHLLIINKPKGMVVHPAAGNYSGTLVNALMYHCKNRLSSINGVIRPGIVHRIDKDTSGLLVVAKNDAALLYKLLP